MPGAVSRALYQSFHSQSPHPYEVTIVPSEVFTNGTQTILVRHWASSLSHCYSIYSWDLIRFSNRSCLEI